MKRNNIYWIIGIVLVILIAVIVSVNFKDTKSNLTSKSGDNSVVYQTKDKSGFIVNYPDGSGFQIMPPEPVANWIFSNDTARFGSGIATMFIPKDSSNQSTPSLIMYARRNAYGNDCDNIQKAIECDKNYFANDPKVQIKNEPTITTKNGSKAYVVSFIVPTANQYDITAYIDADGAMDMIVLSSKSAEQFTASVPEFERVVKSYIYLQEAKP